MKNPHTLHTSEEPLNIDDVRRDIDAIDAQLASLIVRRCNLSAAVAHAKRAGGDTAFGWRPAREVEIARNVVRDQANLDPELAFAIWRALISANLAAQGALTIFTLDQVSHFAKSAFCVGTMTVVLPEATDVLDAIAKDDHAIGVLPWPNQNNWWVEMMEPKYAGLHVCAASPMMGSQPEVMFVAARSPEAAGEDISLIAGPLGAFEGGVMAECDGMALVAVGEFIAKGAILPADCRLIGSFALA